ncbi:MAG: NlpC/P60 family protein [Pseudomonadota bacterium]
MSGPRSVSVEDLARRADIVCHAFKWVGTPYRHQASAMGQGTDCLGLIRGVWRYLYGSEPRLVPPYTPDWVEERGDEPLLTAAQSYMQARSFTTMLPGDMILFRVIPQGPAKHCGIYVGEGRFIHAYAGRDVVASWLSSWWQDRIVGVFSFPDQNP